MSVYNAPTYTQSTLEQLSDSEISYPYSDEYMTYDGLRHQYRLTRKLFEEHGRNLMVEVPGNNSDKIVNFLNAVQLKVYSHIYMTNRSTRNQLNYLIAKRGLQTMDMAEYRQTFEDMMFMEGCYLLDNGDISTISGVDFDIMQNMSIDVMRNQDRDWAKDAIGLLSVLGLRYSRRYKFFPQGKGETW